MEALYSQTAWPLYAKFKHAYDAFRAAIGDPDSIFNEDTMPGALSARPPASAPSTSPPASSHRPPPSDPTPLPPQPSSPFSPPPVSSAPFISSPPSSSSGLDINLRKAILDDICKRLTPTAIKIRADIEVTCFHYEGINAIRSALLKGAELAAPEVPPRPVPPRSTSLASRTRHAARRPCGQVTPPPQRAPASPSSAA